MKETKNSGFTLIELLVVIAIIGLLASVVLVALNNARQKSRDTARAATVNQLSKAMELFFNDKFSYPTTSGLGSAYCILGSAGCLTNLVPSYLAKIPTAPTPADSSATYNCSSAYGTGIANDFQYGGTGAVNTVNNYTMTFCLGSTVGAVTAGVHTLTQGGIQ